MTHETRQVQLQVPQFWSWSHWWVLCSPQTPRQRPVKKTRDKSYSTRNRWMNQQRRFESTCRMVGSEAIHSLQYGTQVGPRGQVLLIRVPDGFRWYVGSCFTQPVLRCRTSIILNHCSLPLLRFWVRPMLELGVYPTLRSCRPSPCWPAWRSLAKPAWPS